MIDIVSVGNQKVEYKDHNDIQFEPLSFYLTLAQKAISKFGSNFSSNVSKEMLKSEDAIANVANCIMMADWRWDKDRKGISGQQKTKYSYRNQCAIWAIKSYLTRKKNKKGKNIDAYLSNFESSDKELSLLDLVHHKNDNPVDIITKAEEDANIKEYLSKILSIDSNILTSRQAEYIKLYYFENLTFAEIGKRFNITREAVRQGIKKAIEKIRSIANVQS
jgi:RNA polymerase sigma factor (sigma-70 family)